MKSPLRWLALLSLVPACNRLEMYDQARFKPFAPSRLFADGRSARPPVPGTIPRGVREAALPLTRANLLRGQERYLIYCSPCHGLSGEGNGRVVQRGYPRPPRFTEPRLRRQSVDFFVSTITNGYGAMPAYRALIPLQDRRAIAFYVQALQLSQDYPWKSLGDAEKKQLEENP